jgi:hypothetical protein
LTLLSYCELTERPVVANGQYEGVVDVRAL